MDGEHTEIVTGALSRLLTLFWPSAHALALLAEAPKQKNVPLALTIQQAFAMVHQEFSGAFLWWKDEKSTFLGACPNTVRASGLSREVFLSGLNDRDQRLPWAVQGAHYMKDDHNVFLSQAPRFDILERQSRANGKVLWVHTRKIPFLTGPNRGGTFGGYEILTSEQAWALARKNQELVAQDAANQG